MGSLAFKLTLAFLFVGLIGAGLVSVFVAQSTQREFDQFVFDRNRFSFGNSLTQFYRARGGWEGVEVVFGRDRFQAPGPERRRNPLVLVDADGTIVFSENPDLVGRQVLARERERALPLRVDGRVVGWLLINAFRAPPLPDSPEAAFLARTTRAIIYSALGATAVALILGILLARTMAKPIRELTAATQALAKGHLHQQVTVRSTDELGQLAVSFNQMSADLSQATQLRRQMTADIAHDLRTPLSVILGYSEALSEGKLQATAEVFEVVHDEALHLSRLVEDLRTLSLADAGELPLTRRPVAPQALLERTASAHKAQAERQRISLQVEAAAELPEVDVDPDRMAQVLGNLVSNALRYTPADGQILLTAETTTDGVALRVRDTGAGIDPADLPYIFERFYRSDRSRQQNGESGLGLPIARSLVEMHGGRISVESSLGQGTTFSITLPVQSPGKNRSPNR
jgi:two-component system, OmpR family, sensor histidine kinase BaeS